MPQFVEALELLVGLLDARCFALEVPLYGVELALETNVYYDPFRGDDAVQVGQDHKWAGDAAFL